MRGGGLRHLVNLAPLAFVSGMLRCIPRLVDIFIPAENDPSTTYTRTGILGSQLAAHRTLTACTTLTCWEEELTAPSALRTVRDEGGEGADCKGVELSTDVRAAQ